jgi:hypothetical protein
MDINSLRIVELKDWVLAPSLGERGARLLNVPRPAELAHHVIRDARQAAERGDVALRWQEACESPGYFRLEAQLPLSDVVFDQLFNGRSGYRAQYYLSPEEGVLFNRFLLDELRPFLIQAYGGSGISSNLDVVGASLMAPHAKLWIHNEKSAFDEAAPEVLNPPRWVSSGATRGRKAPLPDDPTLDVKGSFIKPDTLKIFVDSSKLDRPIDLFNRGYT